MLFNYVTHQSASSYLRTVIDAIDLIIHLHVHQNIYDYKQKEYQWYASNQRTRKSRLFHPTHAKSKIDVNTKLNDYNHKASSYNSTPTSDWTQKKIIYSNSSYPNSEPSTSPQEHPSKLKKNYFSRKIVTKHSA